MFAKGGNAVDAACAMLGAGHHHVGRALAGAARRRRSSTIRRLKKVIGINALGVAPTGATAEFYKSQGLSLSRRSTDRSPRVTPGTPGGLMTMLAEYGTLSLAEVLAPAIQMADGYPIEAQTRELASSANKDGIKQWKYSRAVFLPHAGETREAPEAGEIFVQKDLAATSRKLVDAERHGAARRGRAARRRSTPPTTASTRETSRGSSCAACRRKAGCSRWRTWRTGRCGSRSRSARRYKGIDRLQASASGSRGRPCSRRSTSWRTPISRRMGYNSPKYIHTLYQTMNLAFADRDFYYGDPYFPPEEPVKGLLSKEYAKARYRADRLDAERSDGQAGRSISVPGRHESVRDAARAMEHRELPPTRTTQATAAESTRRRFAFRCSQFSRRHDVDRSRRTRRAGSSR